MSFLGKKGLSGVWHNGQKQIHARVHYREISEHWRQRENLVNLQKKIKGHSQKIVSKERLVTRRWWTSAFNNLKGNYFQLKIWYWAKLLIKNIRIEYKYFKTHKVSIDLFPMQHCSENCWRICFIKAIEKLWVKEYTRYRKRKIKPGETERWRECLGW